MIVNPFLKNSEAIVKNPKDYFNNVLQTVLSIFMLVAVIYFIWHFVFGGYHFIASQGDPKKIEQAKEELTYALIGLAVVLSVFAVLKFVGQVLSIPGLQGLEISWPSL